MIISRNSLDLRQRRYRLLLLFAKLTNCYIQLVENYFDNLMDKYPDGKMATADFIETFKIAFPERPDDKIQKLAVNMSNKDGKICESFFVELDFE